MRVLVVRTRMRTAMKLFCLRKHPSPGNALFSYTRFAIRRVSATSSQKSEGMKRAKPLRCQSVESQDHRESPCLQSMRFRRLLMRCTRMWTPSDTARRERAIVKHNEATNIVMPSFDVGDFVLVRRTKKCGNRLHFKWFVPCRFTAIDGPLVYSVTNLSDSKTERIHSSRLLKYDDSLLGTEVPQ